LSARDALKRFRLAGISFMSKSFLYTGAYGADERCPDELPLALAEELRAGVVDYHPAESQFNAPFTVLRTNDTEKRLTEEEEC
jgi:hypothetical protein